jgi:hypothetical protein
MNWLGERARELFVERQELRGEGPYFRVGNEDVSWDDNRFEAIALPVVSL